MVPAPMLSDLAETSSSRRVFGSLLRLQGRTVPRKSPAIWWLLVHGKSVRADDTPLSTTLRIPPDAGP